MLRRIIVGDGAKSTELANSEASNSIKMGNMLKAYKMEKGNNVAQYVFFSFACIKFGHVNNEDGGIYFTTIEPNRINCTEVQRKLVVLASAMGENTPCDLFSNLAALVFKTRLNLLSGFVFDPAGLEIPKLIQVISGIILKESKIVPHSLAQYSFYAGARGGGDKLLWDPNHRGVCVCLNLKHLEPARPILTTFKELFIVSSSCLYLPSEPENSYFGSYGLLAYDIQQNGVDKTLDVANKFKNVTDLTKYMDHLLNDDRMGLVLRGIKQYISCADDEALMAFTRFLSRRKDVRRGNDPGGIIYSAWDSTRVHETIFEWSITGDDFEIISNDTDIDHSFDDVLSEAGTPPTSPRRLGSHLQQLSRIVDVCYNYSMK
jgi:hypothetical protein